MRSIALAAAALVVMPPAEIAGRCSCPWPGAPCIAAGNASTIFSGTVVDIREDAGGGPLQRRVVRLRRLESFKGIDAPVIEVRTGLGDGDCGVYFEAGRDYLVYAHEWPQTGRLVTISCTRTRLLHLARADVAYLRSRHDTALRKGVVGQVEKLRRIPANGTRTEWDGWLSGAPVALSGAGARWQTATDDSGRFSLWGIPAGSYRLDVGVPDGYVGGTIDSLSVRDTAACAEVRLLVLPAWKP